MSNAFERYAETQMAAAVKAKWRAAETRERNRRVKVVQSEKDAPMKLSEIEQKLADTSKQFRMYLRIKRNEYKELLKGSDGEHWRELAHVLRSLTLESADHLIFYIRQQHWLLAADLHMRQVAVGMINDAIIRLREINGYPPMDDALLDEPPTVFEIIRNELRVLT